MKEVEDKDMGRLDDMLSRYFKGELSEAEEKEFMQLIADDAELRNKAVATARLVKAMNEIGSERDREVIGELRKASAEDVEAIAASVSGGAIKKRSGMKWRRALLSLSAAAAILVCVVGGYQYYKYEQVTSLGSEYLAYFPAAEYSRGEGDVVSTVLKELYSDIEAKRNLGAAIGRLSDMWIESRGDTFNDFTEYMPEIGWMLVNAYLRDNDKTKALEVLAILIAEFPQDTAVGDKARELKAKIEKL